MTMQRINCVAQEYDTDSASSKACIGACIGGSSGTKYPISLEVKQASIPYKLNLFS